MLSSTSTDLPLSCSIRVISSSCNSSALFSTSKIKSASTTAALERSTPICSTTSIVSRMPAVSSSLSGILLIVTYSSITSRVVPGMSVTIALFSLARAFINEDFPTFGRPTIAVVIPSRRIFPWLACFSSSSIPLDTSVHLRLMNSIVIDSTSCSG
ncbi:hypothetical protein D3C78_1438610 [compost metagenome]